MEAGCTNLKFVPLQKPAHPARDKADPKLSSSGHSGRFGHEFLEFDFRVVGDGRSALARYANNSNYRNDSLIRKEMCVSSTVIDEIRRIVKSSEILKRQEMAPKNKDGRQELEIRLGGEHVSFETAKIGSLVDVSESADPEGLRVFTIWSKILRPLHIPYGFPRLLRLRPSGDDSPYVDGVTSASSHAINAQPTRQDQPSTDETIQTSTSGPVSTTGAAGATRRPRRSQQPLDQHINKPLRRHVWASKNRQWTRVTVDKERAEFFDTRVTGRPEVWATLHAVLQMLWAPDTESASGDGVEGLATAQSILDAAEITLPTGNLAQGAYDALGNYYAFHEWIISDPTNMESDDPDDEEASRRREEKGKAVVDVRDLITVFARLSENSRDVKISVAKTDAVRVVARKILEESGLPANRSVRIAYLGKILRDNASLEDQGWKSGHIINALVFQR
ncbi:unnamed protein product [Parascedosporium putredinis]|uniref:Ubiquitin-like domain-containing protein n=1 Tax=Parascedosporium putredinis TaxID=1442378 RepID=A0A9P1M859_9PEZI|nr:unnamed protein product [Parascedosporium putredinis]CAI7989517.1 unnamed protein product [Parascedosporium putredinis]